MADLERRRGACLVLPRWLVDQMTGADRAYAEELVMRQAGGGTPEWKSFGDGLVLVEVELG